MIMEAFNERATVWREKNMVDKQGSHIVSMLYFDSSTCI